MNSLISKYNMIYIRMIIFISIVMCSAGVAISRASDYVAFPLMENHGEYVSISSGFQLYRDTSIGAQKSIDEIWRAVDDLQFAGLFAQQNYFGLTQDALWLYQRIENRNNPHTSWVLSLEQSGLGAVDVWLRDKQGKIIHRATNEQTKFSNRDLNYRFPHVAFDFPVGQSFDVLIRIHADSAIQVPVILATPDALLSHNQGLLVLFGLLVGALVSAVFYYTTAALAQRCFIQLNHVLFVTGFILVLLVSSGIGFQYMWSSYPVLQINMLCLGMMLTTAATSNFTMRELHLNKNQPTMADVFKRSYPVLIAFGFLGFSPWHKYALVIVYATVTLFGLAMLLSILLELKRGDRVVIPVLLAWLLCMGISLGIIPTTLTNLPWSIFSESVTYIASLLIVLLVTALVFREERTNKRQSSSAVVSYGVGHVKQEIKNAGVLADNHWPKMPTTTDQSPVELRDGLTNLYNAYCLEHMLQDAWRKAQEQQKDLCLLIIDIDGLQLINDRYGKGVGDECLRESAARMARPAYTLGGVIGRLGGEEFLIILPGASITIAGALGRALCATVSNTPIETKAGEIALSISVGITSCLSGNFVGVSDFLAHAKHAVQQAKRKGNNRVAAA